jgi:hypothetical protein
MATIKLPPLPTDREDELVRRFRVTLNYLQDLSYYLRHSYGPPKKLYGGLAAELATHRPYLKLQRRQLGAESMGQIQRHLEIAWVTELVLRMPAVVGEGRAFRVTNAWAPVHSYYAVNMALQAWFDANGMRGLTDDHTATLRAISAQIQDRDLFPLPWSLLCEGNPFKRGGCSYTNEPTPSWCSKKIEVLSIPVGLPGGFSEADFFARMGTWLRTTREARLRAREEEWKQKNNRSKMDSKLRKRNAANLHPTSIFDCLWRMRIRSNYRSVETYLVKFVSDEDAKLYHRALATTTRATLCLLESYVARMIGANAYKTMADDFVDQDRHGLAGQTVGRRLPSVLQAARAAGSP